MLGFAVRICYIIGTLGKGGFSLLYIGQRKIPPLNCTFQLSRKHHLFCTVQTADVDVLGGPDRIAATGTDILPGGACTGCYRWRGGSMCAGACDPVAAVFVAVDENVTQIIVQAELQEAVAGACDRPSVFVVVIHDQTVCFCAVPETAVVVSAATGTVLHTVDVIVIVHHLMQQRGADVFDRTGQGTGSDVDLMGGPLLADPGVIPEGEVAVGLRGGLDGDGGS